MRTLDEVIKAYEICMSNESKTTNCMGCPYADEKSEPLCFGEDKKDALYYLKDYLRYQNTPSRIGHMALVDYFDELQKNEPLIWDELKTMEGKPVWIESHEELTKYTGWTIIRKVQSDRMYFIIGNQEDGFFVEEIGEPKCTYGKTWKAYRKERV